METIKMVALDLDGTTLNSKGKLTPEVKTALEMAIARGIHVIFATGRSFSAISQEVLDIKGIRYILSSNGARVIDLRDNSVVYENCFEEAAVEDVAVILGKFSFVYEVFTQGFAYVGQDHYDAIASLKGTDHRSNYVLKTRKPVKDILAFMVENKHSIENININFVDPNARLMMKALLSKKENITLTSSFDHNLEIGGVKTGKGDAVQMLAKLLEISSSSIMAVGDSPNDSSMLQVVGFPVAVGNAKDEVKALAKHITGTNDEGGVAQAINRFVLA